MKANGSIQGRVAFVGSSVPRQCGIATFAADLCDAICSAHSDWDICQVAVTDPDSSYEYPPRTHFEIAERDVASYRRAADFLNINNFSVVCLQHEYGLFGGPAGSHILSLLRELRMPVVTTLHSILREPTPPQARVTKELCRLSDRLVAMSHKGVDFLKEIYKVPAEKIDFIPHGVPDVPFVDPNFYKDQFGVEGRSVLLTFGLLSPDKGIEYVIEALLSILAAHPNVMYMIVGATHPALKRREGEAYRLSLERLAQQRRVAANVLFHNRFVSKEELVEFLCAADVYLTPYLQREQITSGTLSYAVGTGKAIISTPYWHAEELLADGRGWLVPFKDAKAIAETACYVLDHEAERHAARKRAYMAGREITWPQVATRYVETLERARSERAHRARAVFTAKTLDKRPRELPPLNLRHLRQMTDDTGMLQHAVFIVPDYNHGYTTDDNARALVLTILLEEIAGDGHPPLTDLQVRYMAFIWNAFDPARGHFRNFLSYDHRWLDEQMPEDGHARALWALSTVLGRSQDEGLRGTAGRIFDQALTKALEFTSPRAWAFTLIGIHEYLRRFFGARAAQNARETLAQRLLDLFKASRSDDWVWFEGTLAYTNAKLPHAMILSGRWMNRPDMLEAGLTSLDWLCRVQKSAEGHFVPIGTNGFMKRGGERARFDQQPIEAYSIISACLEAYRATGDSRWQGEAQCAFDWFLGANDLHLPLYDPTTGGCRDGLHPDRVNQNQGAESTLAFLLSLVEMKLAQSEISE